MEITRVPGPQKESSELLGQQAELTHIDPQPWSNELSAPLDVSKGCEAFCSEVVEDYGFL